METLLASLLLVGAGGALGGVARYQITRAVTWRFGGAFPWGTAGVNISGALLIGVLAGIAPTPSDPPGMQSGLWIALGVGVLGSYTTVSSFAMQVLVLAREGRRGQAAGYLLGSIAAGLAAVAAGLALARMIAG